MAVAELPYERDLVVYSGANCPFHLRWLPGGEPMDFTGWKAWMPLGTTPDDALQEITTESGEIQLTEDGYIVINMSVERTTELALLDLPKKRYTSTLFYNLNLEDPAGEITRFMRGKLLIEHDVPRPK